MSLKIVRRKGTNHLYLRGTVRGQSVFETTGTDDYKTADAIRIKREAQLLERSVFGHRATILFSEAALSYLEAGGEARFLGQQDAATGNWTLLIGHFKTTPIGCIGQAEADEAARTICPKAGPATRKRHVYVPLCAVLNHAARKGWCQAPIINHPRVPATQPQWATPDYVEKLLPHCAPRLRRFVVVIVYTGARLSEALRLTWEDDIDLSQRRIVFRRTKNGKQRVAHVPDPLLIELAGVPVAERTGRLFVWAHKSHVRKPLMTACKNAGLAYLSPHKLGRHTFATWLRLYAKRDLKGLMEDGGWDSISSVVRYAHTIAGETQRAVDLLPNVQKPCSPDVKPLKDRRTRRKIA